KFHHCKLCIVITIDVPFLLASGTLPQFTRGDANDDSGIDIGDAIFILSYIFSGGAAPSCRSAADANDDGGVDIGDAIFVLSYIFSGGASPAAPFPDCGPDPTADALECAVSSCMP
ncbi:MAG: hypothetical protein KDC38_01410, partial [Planctomycetes bacterium]|nr:hypothetical protein [Planctomycetota bacterium]